MVAIESSDSNEEAPVDTGRHKAHAIKRTAAETLRMMMRIGLGVDLMELHRNEIFLSFTVAATVADLVLVAIVTAMVVRFGVRCDAILARQGTRGWKKVSREKTHTQRVSFTGDVTSTNGKANDLSSISRCS